MKTWSWTKAWRGEFPNSLAMSLDSDMLPNQTSLERAFYWAKSGSCFYFNDIIQHLKSEGYLVEQIRGGSIKKQLLDMI
jgi:hypothetical protein